MSIGKGGTFSINTGKPPKAAQVSYVEIRGMITVTIIHAYRGGDLQNELLSLYDIITDTSLFPCPKKSII
jgi:hypothetical protein